MMNILAWLRRRPLIDVQALRRIDAKPGDVFVLKTPIMLTPEQLEFIRDQWDASQVVPGSKLIFVQQGFDLEVIRQERHE